MLGGYQGDYCSLSYCVRAGLAVLSVMPYVCLFGWRGCVFFVVDALTSPVSSLLFVGRVCCAYSAGVALRFPGASVCDTRVRGHETVVGVVCRFPLEKKNDFRARRFALSLGAALRFPGALLFAT